MATNIKIDRIWHTDVLPVATKKALTYLSDQVWLKRSRWYLAGGTALALQVGHRNSVDLDFFLPADNFQAVTVLRHFKKKFGRPTG